jgi:hypothetical protein
MYVEDPSQFAAFGITEPSWVDWSSYEQDMTGYLILLTEKDGQYKEIFHVDNIKAALGWDGASYATLGSTDWSKQEITFWVDENEWEGKVSLRIATIDAGDASPNRTLRALDADGLKSLDQKFAAMLKKTPAPAAKPASAPGKAVAPPKPGVGAATAKAAPTPKPSASAPTSSPTPPSKAAPAPKPAPSKPAPSSPAASTPTIAADVEITNYQSAWDYVIKRKGTATDDAVAEKWIDASTAVAPGKDESSMTTAECQQVATKTLELLAV